MAASSGATPVSLTIDELIALSDEMAALVRAGIPLEAGLDRLAADLPNRLSRSVQSISTRLQQGQGLAEAVRASPETFPPIYAAVLEAGAQSGRLAGALQALTTTGRRLSELRQIAIASLIYPFLIVLIGFSLLALYVWTYLPSCLRFFADLRSLPPIGTSFLASLGRLDGRWWLAALGVMVAAAIWWWYRSARAELIGGRGAWTVLWLPPARRALRYSRWSGFANLLTLLIEHGVPLAKAIRLSAQATGNPREQNSAEQLATQIEQGRAPTGVDLRNSAWPPLLKWSLASGGGRNRLLSSLNFAAEHYQRLARSQAQWLRTFLPIVAASLVGGAIVVFFALAVFGPWLQIIRELGRPLEF